MLFWKRTRPLAAPSNRLRMWAGPLSMSKRPVCRHFLEGSCHYGIHCRFSHAAAEVPPQLPPKRRPPQAPTTQGPPQAAWVSRQWCTGAQQPAGGPRFRVMSYNVLADELAHSHRAELYRRTPAAHLDWGRRWGMICAEIRGLQPDLVCLQEVDHWQQVERDMQQLGYQGCYAQRSGGRTDGCATFWRSTSFDSLALDTLQFSDYDMRDNVGLLALLALKAASPPLPVVVANTHILFNPKRGDMKLGQLRLLLLRLQELLARALPPAQAARAAALVMGDMNHQPATPVYQFMRNGWVDCLAQHRKAMAGGLEVRAAYGARSSSAPPPPPPPRLLFQQQFQQQLWHPGSSQQQWQQHQQQQQQWGRQQPGQQQGYPWGSQPPPPPPPQWQQQPGQQGQRQQPRMMQHSASAPSLLTTRRLKNAGWSAEELITATGGAHGTHLLHFLEQHHKQQQQQQQQGLSSHSALAAVQTGAADDADIDMDAAGDLSDQQHQQAQTHSSAADGGSSSSSKQARKQQQQQQQQQLGHDQDEQQPQQPPRAAGSSQQQRQQPVAAVAAGKAAAAVERRHKQAWSALDKAQRHATQELAQAGGTQQQLAELAAAQQAERAQLKKQHKRERKQLQQQQQQQQQDQQQDQPGGGVSGVTGAVAAAAAGVGRVPPGAPPAAPAASSAAGSQQGQRLPLPPFFSWGRELWDEPLPVSAGDGVARHCLELRSAYAELTGSEPAFTSCHDSFFGTVDYVWYSPAALQPVAVLLPPCPETHLPHHARCMPNAAIPSDHVSLVCDFVVEAE